MKLRLFLAFVLFFYLINFISATNYNGIGSYNLLPEDVVILPEGYTLKYINFQKDVSWYRLQQLVKGDIANLGLYKDGNEVYSFSVSDIDMSQERTFSNGFLIYYEPLSKDNKELKIKIEFAELSVCYDTDSERYSVDDIYGLNYNQKGKANDNIETINGQNKNEGEDTCLDNKKLKEYFCYKTNEGNSKLNFTEYSCEDDCIDGACKKASKEPTSEIKSINVSKEPDNQIDFNSNICSGCVLESKCYPIGYRMNGNYCSNSLSFVAQLESDLKCDNNFECSSNVCVSGKCINQGLIDKIINWFKNLFS